MNTDMVCMALRAWCVVHGKWTDQIRSDEYSGSMGMNILYVKKKNEKEYCLETKKIELFNFIFFL